MIKKDVRRIMCMVSFFLAVMIISSIPAWACMTRQQVADERTNCLYIYGNDVFKKGTYGNKHHSHSCGADITAALDSSGDYDFHLQNNGNTYFWPYKIDTLCVPECTPGATSSCTTGQQGICSAGTKTCDSQGYWGACARNNNPTTEICNNLDDDCDGQNDESLQQSQTCGIGACLKTITQTCSAGQYTPACIPGNPTTEICNNLDDNCNGQTDENLQRSQTCGTGACQRTMTQTCSAGQFTPACIPGNPTVEICNNFDDNCNGQIDENLQQSQTCGIGACQRTINQNCTGGNYTPGCAPGVPESEVCGNNIDDDCDGLADEGCQCQPGQNMSCGNNTGACVAGTQICNANGIWGMCENATLPAPETCNNLDDDCNGQIDDNLGRTETCGVGACMRNVSQTCTGGNYTPSCVAGVPVNESCANSIDDDCDALVDEECLCTPGQTVACGNGTGIGACANGTQTCKADGTWDVCIGGTGPAAETCNNIDDDCDGQIDEGIQRMETCGTGSCQKTVNQTCTGGNYTPLCQPGAPKVEKCHKISNGCAALKKWKSVCNFIDAVCGRHNIPRGFCNEQKKHCEEKVDKMLAKCENYCVNDCNGDLNSTNATCSVSITFDKEHYCPSDHIKITSKFYRNNLLSNPLGYNATLTKPDGLLDITHRLQRTSVGAYAFNGIIGGPGSRRVDVGARFNGCSANATNTYVVYNGSNSDCQSNGGEDDEEDDDGDDDDDSDDDENDR